MKSNGHRGWAGMQNVHLSPSLEFRGACMGLVRVFQETGIRPMSDLGIERVHRGKNLVYSLGWIGTKGVWVGRGLVVRCGRVS